MSTRQPVRRAARRAFSPSLPIARESWSSGTMTVACLASSSTSTSRTRAGESALATNRAGSPAAGGGREPFAHEPGRLLVEGDDVDLLAAELGDDHPYPRAARAHAGADGIDPLSVRLDRDLRAVAGLTGDAADLDEAVGDLGHLELEERLDQLGIAPGEDDLRALRAAAHLGDDGLDARALLVALAVDLLGARQQGLDLAEVDENVVPVARLLDDPGHDLAHAVDVLVVHHLALGLADPLQDHLLRRLGRDAAEVLGRDVLALDLLLRHLRPVELEVLVGEERVVLLAGLHLEPVELLDRMLPRFLDEPLLEVAGNLDR